jgi:hypothetical protein
LTEIWREIIFSLGYSAKPTFDIHKAAGIWGIVQDISPECVQERFNRDLFRWRPRLPLSMSELAEEDFGVNQIQRRIVRIHKQLENPWEEVLEVVDTAPDR